MEQKKTPEERLKELRDDEAFFLDDTAASDLDDRAKAKGRLKRTRDAIAELLKEHPELEG
jgi:hypothetical protein